MFEILINRRPLSLQAKGRRLQQWKAVIRSESMKKWNGPPLDVDGLHLMIVYLCDESPPDVDNIIKPIQDALRGMVYSDDAIVSDVESHRRPLFGTFDLTRLPDLLLAGASGGTECIYLRVRLAAELEDYFDTASQR